MLKADTTREDWLKVTGRTRDEYLKPIADKYDEVRRYKEATDEDDLTRDYFLKLARSNNTIEGNLIPEGVSDYYSSDWFGMTQAWGLPEDNLLSVLMHSGAEQIKGNDALNAAFHRVDTDCHGKMRFLEHGCGAGRVALGALALAPQAYVTMVDFPNSFRRLLRHCAKKFLSDYAIRVLHIGEDADYDFPVPNYVPYDFVISNEVLEHCIDPVNEVRRIASCMRDGGLFYCSTFFNDCNGKNPTHLREHHQYQDSELWFSAVENCGFIRELYDGNGVLKVFRRVYRPE